MYQKLMFREFITADGLPDVEARTWYPGWWIPYWKNKIVYWLGFWSRYKSYEMQLNSVNCMLNDDSDIVWATRLWLIQGLINNVNCDYECYQVEPYSFVPEDGCPIHDV